MSAWGQSSHFRSLALGLLALGGVLAAAAFQPAHAEENSPVFLLEIPEAGLATSTIPLLYLQSGDVSQLLIYIRRPEADDIGYGDIFPEINGAAAAVITETKASDRGKKVRLDLRHRPGFRLLPGSNTVSIHALDKSGQSYRATFRVHTPKGACQQGKAHLYAVDELGEMLTVGTSNKRLTQLVLDCGVSFQLSPSIEDRLRSLGAQDELIQAIADPVKAEQQGLGAKLSVDDLLNYLESRGSTEEVVEMVRTRGVSFPLDATAEAELRRAGATEALLQAVRDQANAM